MTGALWSQFDACRSLRLPHLNDSWTLSIKKHAGSTEQHNFPSLIKLVGLPLGIEKHLGADDPIEMILVYVLSMCGHLVLEYHRIRRLRVADHEIAVIHRLRIEVRMIVINLIQNFFGLFLCVFPT